MDAFRVSTNIGAYAHHCVGFPLEACMRGRGMSMRGRRAVAELRLRARAARSLAGPPRAVRIGGMHGQACVSAQHQMLGLPQQRRRGEHRPVLVVKHCVGAGALQLEPHAPFSSTWFNKQKRVEGSGLRLDNA